MAPLRDRLQARPASLIEEQGGRSLFVWGDLGQWLVLDAEAALLLRLFARRQRVEDVLRGFSLATARPYGDVRREALPLINALINRRILGPHLGSPPPPDDPLRLSSLTFNITNRCNLNCPWCYNRPGVGSEIAVGALMEWIGAGATTFGDDATFIVLGGEPFLDEPRLREAVSLAREHFPGEILVSTNGTCLSEPTPHVLANVDVTVQVSLDSPSPRKHDSIRGVGVFDRAVANTKRLIDRGVRTILSMVLTRDNEEDLEAYFDLGRALGADEVRFIPLRRIGRGISHSDKAPDLFACFQRLVEILKRRPELVRLLRRDFFSILMTVCRFSCLRGNCGIGRRCLFVDSDGSVFACPNHRVPDLRCGHVQSTPIVAILETSSVLCGLRLQYHMDRMPVCGRCAFRYWCAGDCRAEALTVSGDPSAPSPYCGALQKVMKNMFWLIAEGWEGMGGRHQAVRPWS